jgi:hypothetical protein
MQKKLKYSDIFMVIKIIARSYIGLSSPLHKLLVTGFWLQHIHADKNVLSCQITALLAPTLRKQATDIYLPKKYMCKAY